VFLLKKIVSALILPPTGPLLLLGLGLLLLRRRPRFGRALAWAGFISLWLLATPLVARPFLHMLEDMPPFDPVQAGSAQAIIVLGGGSYFAAPEYGGDTVGSVGLERLRYAARLARATKLPILVSGGAPVGGLPEGQAMREALERDFGLKARWVEDNAADTNENAANSVPMLRQAGVRRAILVTTAWHMPRAQAAFARAGLDTLAAPTAYITTGPFSAMDALPSAGGVGASRIVLHEWLGRAAMLLR
jgi:uncharacterized SAM-binding protein YcdF (DUF218 family)